MAEYNFKFDGNFTKVKQNVIKAFVKEHIWEWAKPLDSFKGGLDFEFFNIDQKYKFDITIGQVDKALEISGVLTKWDDEIVKNHRVLYERGEVSIKTLFLANYEDMLGELVLKALKVSESADSSATSLAYSIYGI